MHKKFEINRTKIKGSCQSGRKVVTHKSKGDLPLIIIFQNNLGIPCVLSHIQILVPDQYFVCYSNDFGKKLNIRGKCSIYLGNMDTP